MSYLTYTSWPLGRQLKVSFILCSFLVSVSLIIITIYQLSWLSDQIILHYTELLSSSMLSQLQMLGSEEVEFITIEMQNFMDFVQKLNEIDKIILGLSDISPPIIPSIPVQDTLYNATSTDYSTGCFMSSIENLSQQGLSLEKREAGMDKIYPLLITSNYLFIYSGFEIDKIIHYYPAQLTSDRSYNPLSREWYYTAKDRNPQTIITEPYQDSTSYEWIVTVSKAINDQNGNFYGVAACDITLKDITSKTSRIQILQNGFILLITAGGMILTVPETWNLYSNETVLIFDSQFTGIDLRTWQNITGLSNGDNFEFTRNNLTYLAVIYKVQPYSFNNFTTHYLLIVADQAEILQPIIYINNNYSYADYTIFTIVITIVIFVFAMITGILQIFTIKFSRNLNVIKRILSKLSYRALLPFCSENLNLKVLNVGKNKENSLFAAVKIRLKRFKECEKNFAYFFWGETRPEDKFYFNQWKEKLYPFNLYSNEFIQWKRDLSKINVRPN